jgi:hypothetical protein
MFKVLRDWIQRYFSDEEAVVLAVLLVLAFTAVLTLGGMLAPVLAGMVLAFLMQGLVNLLERLRVPSGVAVGAVFALFMGALALFMLVLVPLLWHQLITLFNELPGMLGKWQSLLLLLPERYPHLVSDEQVLQAIEAARGEIGKFGQWALTFSLSSLPLLVNIMIYFVLVPILVFFFLKDRTLIGHWVSGYLPRERALLTRVAQEMNRQIANYIRGKVIEIFICGVVTYIAFVGPAGGPVGGRAVRGSGGGDRAGDLDCPVPMGLGRPVHLPDGGLRHHPDPGWQRAGAVAVLGSRELASRGDHLRGAAVRRAVGVLGHLFRHPPRDAVQGGSGCLAPAGALGGAIAVTTNPMTSM